MSLALVTVETHEFDLIYQHLLSHNPKCRNMHMREACQRNGKRTLRYLHAMYAPDSAKKQIEGMISGPEVFWHYRLVRLRSRTQIELLDSEAADTKAKRRILSRFLKEILNRMHDEESGPHAFPKLSRGQYYLRRKAGGIAPNHLNCISAVRERVLAPAFVSQLEPWNFALLHQ